MRRRILEQTDVFKPEDMIPVPCHPDSLAMAYALKLGERRRAAHRPDRPRSADRGRAQHHRLRAGRRARAKASSSCSRPTIRRSLKRADCATCCAACRRWRRPTDSATRNIFRVLIVQFIDAHSFDVRSVKKTCVHIVHPDGRLIPFDTYNLFYRDELEQSRLAPLRQWAERSMLKELS